MAYLCQPYFQIEAAAGQFYRSIGLRTVIFHGGHDGQVFKMRIAIAGNLVSFAIYRLMEISLAVQQSYAHEWQSQVAGRLAVIACQNTQPTGINRETFVEAEFSTEVSDQVLPVQPVRAARRQTKIMIGVIGRQYAVEVADEYLILCRIDQALLVDTL